MEHRHRLTIENAEAAAALIDPVFLNSPEFVSDSLSGLFELSLILKIETVNPVRCFKGRGAEIFAAKALGATHFVCASAGNFGQAMAYSCRKNGLPLTVYASAKANAYKLERMRSLGAEVILAGDDFDSAKLEAKRQCAETGARFIEDGLDIESLEGAATIALELLKFSQRPNILLIPLGNGALFNGVARIIKHYAPEIETIAVQSRGAPAMAHSWRSSSIITYETISTVADGIAVRIPIPQALKDMNGLVDDALLVDDATIIKAMQLIHHHVGIVCEPSAAVGLAAIMENPSRFRRHTVATIITGGNLTREQMEAWLK